MEKTEGFDYCNQWSVGIGGSSLIVHFLCKYTEAVTTIEHMKGNEQVASRTVAGRRFIRPSLWGVFDAGVAIVILFTVVSFLGNWLWLFEMASHFRIQYLCVLALAVAVYGAKGQFGRLACATAAFLLCSPALYSAYVAKPSSLGVGPTFKTMVVHVNPSDGNFSAALELLRSEEPALVVMEDVSPEWERIMRGELSRLPNARFITKDGMAVLSVRAWERVERSRIPSFGFPGLKITYRDPALTVFAVHIPAPISAEFRKERLTQFSKLIRQVNAAKGSGGGSMPESAGKPVLVMGDFNCSPWSPLFQRLLSETDLQDTRRGFGIKPTWPSITPPFLIPIDHVLVSRQDLQVIDVRVGPYIGSDHYPLIVTLRRSKGLEEADSGNKRN